MFMKIKRLMFILSLILIFCLCFINMNEHYDEFSRYPFTLSEQCKKRLLQYLNKNEINYMIENQLSYDVVNTFMEYENFDIENVTWYDKALQTRSESKQYIVNFINRYRDQLDYEQIDPLFKHYSYNEFALFCEQNKDKLQLIADPTINNLQIQDHQSVYQYVPKNLKKLSKIKTNSIDESKRMFLNDDALKALKSLLKDAYEISDSSQGDFVVYITYLSYEQQALLYPNHPMIKKPGCNDYQLGYSVCLTTNKIKPLEDESEEEYQQRFKYLQEVQLAWLKDNAYKYGFKLKNDHGYLMNEQLYFELRYESPQITK